MQFYQASYYFPLACPNSPCSQVPYIYVAPQHSMIMCHIIVMVHIVYIVQLAKHIFFSTNNITKLKRGCQPCILRTLICSLMIQLLLA